VSKNAHLLCYAQYSSLRRTEKIVHFFARSKETNQRKGAQQLGLRLSSRRTRTRGRQELIPLLAGLRQLAALIPRPQPSLGCAATGFKNTKDLKEKV